MKANELMIGDWVLDKKTNQPYKIIGTNDLLFHDDYSPIPLTAEILEKNFLTQRGEWTEPVLYFFGDEYIEVCIKEYTDGIWEVVIDEVEMSCLPTWKMFVCNVHELQHALQLCNIDKEIKL